MILSSLTNTALALVLTVTSAGVGLTGLSPDVRIRRGNSTTHYLDFSDNTFKTSGWTTQEVALVEIGDGHYQDLLNVNAIVGLVSGDSIVAEFHNASGPAVDWSETIVLVEVARVSLTLTVDMEGGVTGLTAAVKVRDATTVDKYLDWNDNTFKTSGWTTISGGQTEVQRGHYHRLFDAENAVSFSGVFVAEYHATGSGLTVDQSEDVVGIPDASGDPLGDPPTVENVTPNEGAVVTPQTVVGFDVVDPDDDLFDVVVFVVFKDDGIYEVVWDGDTFAPLYLQGSRREVITNGFRYTLQRSGNWPELPKVRIRAFDSKLNLLT